MASEKKKSTSTGKKKKNGKAEVKEQSRIERGRKPSRKSEKVKPLEYKASIPARAVGAAVCVFFAIMILLGMFRESAVVVDFLCKGVKGLVGYAFWITPAAFLAAAVLLLIQRAKPVRGRLCCLALFVIFVGALFHLLLCRYEYTIGPEAIKLLWKDGLYLNSGGVFGGFLSVSFCTWFSRVGAGIFFVILTLLMLAIAFHITPAMLLRLHKRVREYDDSQYYDDPLEDPLEIIEEEENEDEQILLPLKKRQPVQEVSKKRKKPKEKKPSILSRLGSSLAEEPEAYEEDLPFVQSPKTQESEPIVPIVRTAPEPPKKQQEKSFEEEFPPAEKTPARAEQKEEIRKESIKVAQTIESGQQVSAAEYTLPSLDLLTKPSETGNKAAREELEGTLRRLDDILTSFGIDGQMEGAVQGPSVTRYEVELAQGVRLSKLTNLSDDVALALGVSSVRIAPVPGKIRVVGIEVPNKIVESVTLREVIGSQNFQRHKSSVAFSVGKDIGGNYIIGDCSKLPHMLIAGTTGSGKSVCVNSLLISLLYKSSPEDVRLIMVDPKMVELGIYNGIPHLLIPVVTDPKKAAGALQWAVTEMMRRYRIFADAGVRELSSYNTWAEKQENAQHLPKIVIVIDELADLMMVAAKEVEDSICRVAQMGRASGMHLVIATQRPSADVITGLMKANIPSRIAFAVASSLESRIILDNTGAEKLVGKGDMLWAPLGTDKPQRVQGCFVSDAEIAAVVEHVKASCGSMEYDNEILNQIEKNAAEDSKKKGKGVYPFGEDAVNGAEEEQDECFPAAVDIVLDMGQASVSMLQRRLKLGYARAARLVDMMEQKGIVGPFEGSKPRQLLMTKEQWEAIKNGGSAPETEPVEEEILPFEAVDQKFPEF